MRSELVITSFTHYQKLKHLCDTWGGVIHVKHSVFLGDSGEDSASESGEFSHYGCDGFFLRPILSWVGSTRPGANRIRQRAVDLPRPGPGVRWGTGAQLRRYSHPAGPLIFPAASLGSPHSA